MNEKNKSLIQSGSVEISFRQETISKEQLSKILECGRNHRLIDVTGAELKPGDPENCQGNGEHPDFECCCDECDYYLACFPEAMPQ